MQIFNLDDPEDQIGNDSCDGVVVYVAGPAGPQGSVGPQGPTGPQGPSGGGGSGGSLKVFNGAGGGVDINTPVLYDTLIFNTTDGTYDSLTGLFTCGSDGIYQVSAVSQDTSGAGASMYVGKNGPNNFGYMATMLVLNVISGLTLVECIAGDTLGVYVDASMGMTAGVGSMSITKL